MNRNNFTFIDSHDDEEQLFYCPYCSRVKVVSKLGPRIYDSDELPYDADEWMQCYKCGKVIPIYESKEEGEYVPIVDVIDNPFDAGSEFHSPDKRKSHDRLKDYRDKEELDR